MANQVRKKYNEQDYINKCNELSLQYIGTHKEGKRGTMIEFICPQHENKGIQCKDWSHFKTYTYGCTYCSGRGKSNIDIIKEINNPTIELISDYKGNEKPIECCCKLCGNVWITLPKVLITNKAGCPKCGIKKSADSRRKTKQDFIQQLKLINSDILVVGDYINTHTKIKCKCKRCGTEWDAYPANLLNKSAGCLGCNISIGEKILLDALKDIGIQFIPQYPINDGVHKKPLRFDAYDFIHNIAFEYNGEQHYFPVDFARKGQTWAEKEFVLTQERDKCKRKYCTDNNIFLITIPYWERDNIKELILDYLKEVTNKIA